MAIKIMIADDHSMIREGLKSLLELEGDIQVVAEAEDGVDCLEKLKICTPDVLLLDINMPRKNGLEVLQTLKSSKSKIKVLVLTTDVFFHTVSKYLTGIIRMRRSLQELREFPSQVYVYTLARMKSRVYLVD